MCHFMLLFKGNTLEMDGVGWLAQCGILPKSIPEIFHGFGGNCHGC